MNLCGPCSGLRHQAGKPARNAGAAVLGHGVRAHVEAKERIRERLRFHDARLQRVGTGP